MPSGTFRPTSIWSDWECNSGTPLAYMPAVISWRLAETIETHLVMKRLTVTVPTSWTQFDTVTTGAVIRLEYRDEATDTDDWEEYRITDVVTDRRAGTATVSAVWWIQDLLEQEELIYQQVALEKRVVFGRYAITPSQGLADVVAALPSYWSVSTVTPTETGDVAFSRDTPLSGGLKVAAMAKMTTGTTYELSARRNGTSGLYLDLTVYGSGAIDARVGKNLVNVRQTTKRADQTTRVAFGTDQSMQRPIYVISAVSAGSYIEVTDILATNPGPAQEADQWNGAYWYEVKNGTSHAITDTVVVDYNTTRLSMSSTTGMATGERGYLAADSSGNDLLYVDSPSAQASYGLRLGVITGGDHYTNYLSNGDLRSGSSTTPTGYTLDSGTATRVDAGTGLVRQGGYAYYFNAAGVIHQSQTIYAVAGEVWTYTWYGFISSFGAAATVKFRDPQTATDTTIAFDGTDPDAAVLNTYVSVSRSFSVTSTGAKTFQITVSRGVNGSFYFDAAQLVRAASAPTFRVGSGSADNIATANALLSTNGPPLSLLDAELADLSVLAPRDFGDEAALLGGTCTLTDGELGLDSASYRILSKVTDSGAIARPRIGLANRPSKISDILARAL